MKLPTRAVGLFVILTLLAADTPQDPGAILTVTRRTTKLRAQKKMFAAPVADLREGDKLAFERRDGAWLRVRSGQLAGWLHETDVSTNPDVRLSGQGVRENYSASETSAARKGFNPQVEQNYRGKNPNLEAAFQLVDRLQARATPETDVQRFLTEGGLLQEGR
ncbi:MAG: hypothetical protein FJ265_00270 [Planctomycetes bacterium]|nr:hypothetical protein [Planctomycetota bacterium]